jgi:hypothetical protein
LGYYQKTSPRLGVGAIGGGLLGKKLAHLAFLWVAITSRQPLGFSHGMSSHGSPPANRSGREEALPAMSAGMLAFEASSGWILPSPHGGLRGRSWQGDKVLTSPNRCGRSRSLRSASAGTKKPDGPRRLAKYELEFRHAALVWQWGQWNDGPAVVSDRPKKRPSVLW